VIHVIDNLIGWCLEMAIVDNKVTVYRLLHKSCYDKSNGTAMTGPSALQRRICADIVPYRKYLRIQHTTMSCKLVQPLSCERWPLETRPACNHVATDFSSSSKLEGCHVWNQSSANKHDICIILPAEKRCYRTTIFESCTYVSLRNLIST
jgi:hypothetical protein